MRADDIRRVESFDIRCLRTLAKVKWADHVTTKEVRVRCSNILSIGAMLRKRRLQWFGHVSRRDESTLVRQVLDPTICTGWKRRSGASQIKTWLDSAKEDVDYSLGGLDKVYGLRRWKVERVKICCSSLAASDRKAWAAALRSRLIL